MAGSKPAHGKFLSAFQKVIITAKGHEKDTLVGTQYYSRSLQYL